MGATLNGIAGLNVGIWANLADGPAREPGACQDTRPRVGSIGGGRVTPVAPIVYPEWGFQTAVGLLSSGKPQLSSRFFPLLITVPATPQRIDGRPPAVPLSGLIA
jgi:hypothetical protein